MNVKRLVQILALLGAIALIPLAVQKVLLRLTATVVRDERRHR